MIPDDENKGHGPKHDVLEGPTGTLLFTFWLDMDTVTLFPEAESLHATGTRPKSVYLRIFQLQATSASVRGSAFCWWRWPLGI